MMSRCHPSLGTSKRFAKIAPRIIMPSTATKNDRAHPARSRLVPALPRLRLWPVPCLDGLRHCRFLVALPSACPHGCFHQANRTDGTISFGAVQADSHHYSGATRETCEKAGWVGCFIFVNRARLACLAYNSQTKSVAANW